MTTHTSARRAARRLRRNDGHVRRTAAARPSSSLGEVRIELTVEEILADLVYPSPPPASEDASSTSSRVP